MTQALTTIGKVLFSVDTKSRKASYPVRVVLGFGIVAAGYIVIAVAAVHGMGAHWAA